MSPCPCKGRAVPRARSRAPRNPRSTANGSTVFTDVRGHAVTGLGSSPQITTAQGISGGASFAAAGTSYLATPSAPEFAIGSNSFTVEAWIYPQPLANPAATQGIVTQQLFTTTIEGGLCLCVQNGQLIGNLTDASGNVTGVTGPTLVANAWSHVALVGTPGTLTLYVNGQSVGSTPRGAAQNNSPLPLTVGADASGAGIFAGDIDEVRFTNGVARYSANFSPSAPYPDTDPSSGNPGANSTAQAYNLSAGQQGAASISGSAGSATAINLSNVATTPTGGSVSLTIANCCAPRFRRISSQTAIIRIRCDQADFPTFASTDFRPRTALAS